MVSRRLPPQLGAKPRALLTHIAKGLVIDHWRSQEVERAYLEVLALMPIRSSSTWRPAGWWRCR